MSFQKFRGSSHSMELYRIAEAPSPGRVEALLAAGADPQYRPDSRSDPAFLKLVGHLPLEGLQLLARAGADLRATTVFGRAGTLQLLLRRAPPDLCEQLRWLLGEGVAVEAPDSERETPLRCAAGIPNAEAVGLLLEHGARPDTAGAGGETALHAAARAGCAGCITSLLSHGANPTLPDRHGLSALHAAVDAGKLQAAEALLDGGAHVDFAAPPDGFTALRLAVNGGDAGFAQLLQERGANLHQPAADGRTPLQVARLSGDGELLLALGDESTGEEREALLRAERAAADAIEAEVLGQLGAGAARFLFEAPGYRGEEMDVHCIRCDGGQWAYERLDGMSGATECMPCTRGQALGRMRELVAERGDFPVDTARRIRDALAPGR